MIWLAAQHRRGAAHLVTLGKVLMAHSGMYGHAECGAPIPYRPWAAPADTARRRKCPGCLAAQARMERKQP